jgi:predicted MFS family arabinose efflux permease
MKSSEKKSNSYLKFLRKYPEYSKLWAGGFISLMGENINHVAAVLLILEISGGSGLHTGLVIGLRFFMKLVCAGMGGVWADRYDRRRMLILLDLLMAATAFAYIFVTHPGDIWLLYVLTALMGGSNAVFITVRFAFTPDLVGKPQIGTALGLNSISTGISMMCGFAAGGMVVGLWGYQTAFVMNGIGYLLSAGLTWSIHYQTRTAQKDNPAKAGFRQEFVEGLLYLKEQTLLWKMIALNMCWALGGGGLFVIIAMFNHHKLGNSEQTLGMIYAMAGIGMLSAALIRPYLVGRSRRQDILLLGLTCITEGILFIMVVSTTSSLTVILLFGLQMSAAALFGLVYGPLMIAQVSDVMRGRVLGLDNSLFLPTYGLSSALYGILLNSVDVSIVGCISGGMMALAGLIWLGATAKGCIPLTEQLGNQENM